MKNAYKKLAAMLPRKTQQGLKRLYYGRQIDKGEFETNEIEYGLLDSWLHDGDWVIDIGANIGHYSLKMASIVGSAGRVIAFEPVPATFELLSANVSRSDLQNITLINAAASDTIKIQGIEIPTFDTGLDNFYMAHLSDDPSSLNVLCMPVDSFNFPHRIALIKIDAEGHDLNVIKGMNALLKRDHPVLIVEDQSDELADHLETFGYTHKQLDRSHNTVFNI